MKRTYLLIITISIFVTSWSQNHYRKPIKPTKNIILMIPDGTSLSVISAARWYNAYNNPEEKNLNIDPYICGTVLTYSSNAPIGDSAPTTSCYMTGVPAQAGNVSIYPVATKDDIIPLDPVRAYQPLATVLEAVKTEQKKAVGLVVTVEFPHATPADCAAHYYNRGSYKNIGMQMAYNNLDVMFGGGVSLINDEYKDYFENNNTTLLINDLAEFRNFNKNGRLWALFENMNLPFDIDRDQSKIPSLEEMTQKALDQLSKNKNGFFLMVEGSQIDFNAHDNDALGCITEYLAFDKAVKAAIDFAKKDGNTTVVILPDHGNSGFSIGRRDLPSYGKATKDDLFGTISKYKRTGKGLEKILIDTDTSEIKRLFKENTEIELNKDEWNKIISSKNYFNGKYALGEKTNDMWVNLKDIMNEHTYFGFTTGGHTGEEVFLAVYHPKGDIPIGLNTNIEINQYLCAVAGLKRTLPEITKKIYSKHDEVFNGFEYTIESQKDKSPTLTVNYKSKKLFIEANKSIVHLNNKRIDLNSVVVYIDKNNTFYLPESLRDLIEK